MPRALRQQALSSTLLAKALASLATNDDDLALDALVEAWRAHRSVELAELVEKLSARLEPLVPPFAGRPPTFHPAWLARAEQRRAADLPLLLGSVLTTTNRFGTAVVRALLERGAILATWPADPRTGALVVAHLESGGYESTSRSTLPFWTSLFRMLRTHDDPRTLDLLRPLRFARIFGTFSDGKRRIAWFQESVDALIDDLAKLAKRHPGGAPRSSKDLAPQLAELRRALARGRPSAAVRERLALVAAPPAPQPATRPSAKRASGTAIDQLTATDHLSAAIAATTNDERLVSLLAAWRVARAPEIAALVARVSRRLEARLPPIRGANRAAAQLAWLATAQKRDPADLPRLLDSITDTKGRSTDALARLQALADWPPDPRTLARVVAQLEAPPFHSSSAQPFWSALIRLAQDHAAPHDAPVLEALAARVDRVLVTRDSERAVTWFRRHLTTAASELAETSPRPLDAAETQASAQLAKRLGEAEEILLHEIAAHPDDDEPRSVYADWLQEHGDPRGELIALQLAKRAPDRVAELHRDHAHSWIGPLAPFIDLAACRFERGFLSHVQLKGLHPSRFAAIADDAVWSTVRTIDLGYPDESPTTFPVSRAMRSLKRVTVETGSGPKALRLKR